MISTSNIIIVMTWQGQTCDLLVFKKNCSWCSRQCSLSLAVKTANAFSCGNLELGSVDSVTDADNNRKIICLTEPSRNVQIVKT